MLKMRWMKMRGEGRIAPLTKISCSATTLSPITRRAAASVAGRSGVVSSAVVCTTTSTAALAPPPSTSLTTSAAPPSASGILDTGSMRIGRECYCNGMGACVGSGCRSRCPLAVAGCAVCPHSSQHSQ
jgi:hypothetical protein